MQSGPVHSDLLSLLLSLHLYTFESRRGCWMSVSGIRVNNDAILVHKIIVKIKPVLLFNKIILIRSGLY